MGILLNATELPSPELLAVYRTFEYVMLGITILTAGYTLVVMTMSSSKALTKYKWYLMHGIIWGVLFDMMLALIGAVALFPLPCYYGINFASRFGGATQLIYFSIGANCMIGKCYAVFLQFEHRFQQAIPPYSWYRKYLGFLHGRYEVHIRVILYLIVAVPLNVMLIVSFPNQADQQSFLSNQDPVLAEIYRQHPTTICFSGGVRSYAPEMTAMWGVLLIGGELLLCVFTYHGIHQSKHNPNTFRLQMMLFWSLIAQMAAYLIFMSIPGLLYLSASSLGIRGFPKISVICAFFFVSHTTVDSLMILFFIKPYRQVVISNARCAFLTHRKIVTVNSSSVELKELKVVS